MTDKPEPLNCWEFKNCGREPGGLMSEPDGPCPAATALKYDGINGGVAAGRFCWIVAENEGCPASGCRRAGRCHQCDFYRRVAFEEDDAIVVLQDQIT